MTKRWIVLLVMIMAAAMSAGCDGEEPTTQTEEPLMSTVPSETETGEVTPQATEAVETPEINLVESTVCERFEPPTPAAITPAPGSLAAIRPNDWSRGPEDAPVTILEYINFR